MAETTKQKLGFSPLEPDRMYNAFLNIAGAFIVFVTACTVYGQIQANYIHVDKVTTFTIMRDAPDLGLLASATDTFDKAICPAASASSLSAGCVTHLKTIRSKVLDAARCNKWPGASPSCTCTYTAVASLYYKNSTGANISKVVADPTLLQGVENAFLGCQRMYSHVMRASADRNVLFSRNGLLALFAAFVLVNAINYFVLSRITGRRVVQVVFRWVCVGIVIAVFFGISVANATGNYAFLLATLFPPLAVNIWWEWYTYNDTEPSKAEPFLHPMLFTYLLQILSIWSATENYNQNLDQIVVLVLHAQVVGILYFWWCAESSASVAKGEAVSPGAEGFIPAVCLALLASDALNPAQDNIYTPLFSLAPMFLTVLAFKEKQGWGFTAIYLGLVATVLAYFVQQYVLVWVWNAPTVYPLQNALSPPTWAPTEPTF
jgi:hypothetical protein